jgi:hypothetical protein
MAKQPAPYAPPLQHTHSPALGFLGHLIHGAQEVASLPGNIIGELSSGKPHSTFTGDIGSGKSGGGGSGSGGASAPPQSLQDQINALGLPASLMPQGTSQGFTQYLDAVQKVNSSKLDASVKSQLLNTLASNYQAQQQRQAQEPSQLAYQAFYNQTVLPYLQQQIQGTKNELAPIFQAMTANLSNIPPAERAMFAQGNSAMQAGADQYLTGLGQNALQQPLLNQLLTSVSADISAQQAAQKAAAQSGAISGAQAITGAVPGATVSIPAGF